MRFRCHICSENTYALTVDDSSCKECPPNSECPGGKVIDVDSGFWRSGFFSDNVMECFYDEACPGGELPENYSTYTSSTYPLCEEGYGGNLCHNCLLVNETLYTRVGNHKCGVCPSKIGNIVKILGIFLALLLALGALLWINLRSTRESETSVVIRIFLNYVQIFATAASFNL